MLRRISFFQKNLLLSALFTLLIGFTLTAASYFFEGRVIEDTLAQQGKGMGTYAVDNFSVEDVQQAAQTKDIQSDIQKKMIGQLDALAAKNQNVTSAYFLATEMNANGTINPLITPTVLIEAGYPAGTDYPASPEFITGYQQAIATKAATSTPIYSDDIGTFFTVFAPMLNAQGEVIAVFGFDMSANIIKESQLQMLKWLLIALVTLFVVIFVIQYINLKRMLKPIHELSVAVHEVGSGNFDIAELVVKSEDEVGVVVRGFNQMVARIRGIMKSGLETATEQLATTFEQVSNVSNTTSNQAEHVMRSLQEISTATEQLASEAERGNHELLEINTHIAEILEHTSEAAHSINTCTTESRRGITIVESLKEISSETEQITLEVGREIYSLEERTRRINNLLASIQEVAEQTSLLSLNASIEAARAGEHGRGFSIVAEEIRKLSTNTKQASEEISALLGDISGDISSTGHKMRSAEVSLREQSAHVDNTIRSFYHIRDNIDTVVHNIEKVNQSVLVVENTKEALLNTVESVSSMSEETAASVEMIQQNFLEQVQAIQGLNESCQAMQEQANRLTAQLKGQLD